MGLRGETSAGFDQKSFDWEVRDDSDADRDVSLLGMPAESDWALYAPYNDKSLMRNELVYSLMRKLRGEGSAMRTRFCEVFINDDPLHHAEHGRLSRRLRADGKNQAQ